MNAKFTLAIIALVGIGVFALPSTMSLFAGQHSFYNIDATGNQVPCQKCHGDVKAELGSNANTNPAAGPLTAGPHASFQCEYCHRIEAGAATGDNAYGLVSYSDGVTKRSIIVTVFDFEKENFPAVFENNWTTATEIAAETGIVFAEDHGTLLVAVSPSNTNYTRYNLPLFSERLIPTYNKTTGLPKDTSTVKDQGFKPNKINQSTGWVLGTGSRGVYDSPTLYGAGSKAVNPGTEYHAASLVSCMECHGGEEPFGHYTRVLDGTKTASCEQCHYGSTNRWTELAAGGFGLTSSDDDSGANEAHNAWVKTNDTINRFGNTPKSAATYGKANNGACIACHTHVAVDIAFEKGYKLSFDAKESATGKYTVSNAAVEGKVHIDIYGNGSGATYGVGDKSYTWTPSGTLYMNGGSTVISGLNGDSDDSAAALTSP